MRTFRNLLIPIALVSIASLTACNGGDIESDTSDEATGSTEEFAQATYAKKILTPAANAALVPDQYIVVFHDDHMPLRSAMTEVRGLAEDVMVSVGLRRDQVTRTYNTALNGFVATLSAKEVKALALDPAIKYIEQDSYVTVDVTWGLDRTDQRDLPLDNVYNSGGSFDGNGAGVHAYIVDTGIHSTHTEFTGRVGNGTDAIDNDSTPQDGHGHGTHVSGTVGGTTYGMAPGVTLHGVRVLNNQGSGTNAQVIAGIDWVAANHIDPAVANMSLGGSFHQGTNDAVTNAVNAGVVFAVAAGNETTDACTKSPASTPAALTVAATTNTDARASFSNFGSCVDIHAPGNGITSAWNTSNTATNTISGTSMASPHVCGAAALYRANNPSASVSAVNSAVTAAATSGKVTGANGSPNLLLYVGGGSPPPPPTSEVGLCTDGVDNDQDGSTDCNDSDCASDAACNQPPPGSCPTGYTRYTGTISAGQSHVTAGASSSGLFNATLTGSAPDIDLYLQRRSFFGTWSTAASSLSASSNETINYNGSSGTYRWRVYGYSGSNISYTLCANKAL